MKSNKKIVFAGIFSLFAVIGLSSCTKSFCSNVDTARALAAFDPGVTKYETGSDSLTVTDGSHTYVVTNVKAVRAEFSDTTHNFYYYTDELDSEGNKKITYDGVSFLNNAISGAREKGYISVTSNQVNYFQTIDDLVLESVCKAALKAEDKNITRNLLEEDELALFRRDLSYYSHLKFINNESDGVWSRWDLLNEEVRNLIPVDQCISTDFITYYKSYLNTQVAQYRTCLATNTDKYGTYGYSTDGIYVEAKSWSYAWSKGFFEGLLVYPIGWLIDQIAAGFNYLGAGPAALLAILFVTLIVRGVMMLITFKQTAGNAKMTELQPEITKIQNKYPNANTNKYEKQRMAEEMNALYKKHNINPFTTLLVLIVQFPVFICVWGALSGASVLTNGSFLGLNLAVSIREAMLDTTAWTAAGGYAGVTAFFLFLLMGAAQAVSMLLPQWMQKIKAKKVARLSKNPSQKSNDNKMKWVTYIMLIMIIIMGFSLVSAMGVYWFIGAVLSIIQTLITQAITERKTRRGK